MRERRWKTAKPMRASRCQTWKKRRRRRGWWWLWRRRRQPRRLKKWRWSFQR
jgi:hypothetical protein